jgi:hypothetical protein
LGVATLASAQMEVTGDAALVIGQNVIAGGAHNDSTGSSDLTLIVQVLVDGSVVFDEGDAIKAIQPTGNIPSDADPTGWTKPGFSAAGWEDGTNGVGYGDGDDNTTIGDGSNATVYMIGSFDVSGAPGMLEIGVDYDDACVIYINGSEVARTTGTDIASPALYDDWSDQGSGQSHEASKADPPAYEMLEIAFTATAVEAEGKLATAWGSLKSVR